jgi:hypothetical protein
VFALYRQVGLLGRQMDIDSRWPFANLAVGQAMPGLSSGENPSFTGFCVLCADNSDALGAVFSVSVVARDWDRATIVVLGQTAAPTGWALHLSDTITDVTCLPVDLEVARALSPSRLPVAVYVHEGRVLDASVALASPSVVAERFQHVASPLRDTEVRSIEWR